MRVESRNEKMKGGQTKKSCGCSVGFVITYIESVTVTCDN